MTRNVGALPNGAHPYPGPTNGTPTNGTPMDTIPMDTNPMDTTPMDTTPTNGTPTISTPATGGISPIAELDHPPVDVEAEAAESPSTFAETMSVIRDTITLRSSIFDYEYENGRRYHAYKPGIYLLPNDDREQERLESTYHIWNLVLGGNLCLSELSNPRRILDIGTGTGSWAMDMGDQYPNAEIIGTDLSPIQHEEVPSNVRFEIDDCRDPWLYEEDYFDFIHIRTLAGAIQNWPRLLEQCYRHLKPGGKLEISEGRANFWWKNDTVPEDSYTYRWLKEWRRLAPQVQFDIFPFLPDMLRELPFTGLRPLEKLVPLGPWPHDKKLKEIGGEFLSLFLDNTLEAFTLALFTRTGGWKQLELEVLLAHVRQELMTGKMHLYTFCSFLTAEKPRTARSSPGAYR